MTCLASRAALLALLTGALSGPAMAGTSSASSASSDGSSASVGSVSTSLEGSSNSSKGDKVAAGEYRVIDVAAAPARPGAVRVTLRPLGDGDDGFVLVLPQAAADQGRLAAGQVVTARTQSFGIEFAAGQPRQAFFLVVHDAAMRELQTRPVTL